MVQGLKKSLNASRPSEHPPVRRGKNVKPFGCCRMEVKQLTGQVRCTIEAESELVDRWFRFSTDKIFPPSAPRAIIC